MTARRCYAVVVKETMTHTVYVNASTAAEARELGRDNGNWIDDDQDFSEAAPVVVRSVRNVGDPL